MLYLITPLVVAFIWNGSVIRDAIEERKWTVERIDSIFTSLICSYATSFDLILGNK